MLRLSVFTNLNIYYILITRNIGEVKSFQAKKPQKNYNINKKNPHKTKHMVDQNKTNPPAQNEDEFEDDLEIIPESSNDTEAENEEQVVITKTKIELINKIADNIEEGAKQLKNLLAGTFDEEDAKISIGQLSEKLSDTASDEGANIIEGVFDGESMIGPDGKQYSIPANYASKSKLVEGDILKLTITGTGTFVYKQIGPIERKRVIGELEKSTSGNFVVRSKDRTWRVITASVTYYKGDAGDEVVILVPKIGESKWAAVENIVKKIS